MSDPQLPQTPQASPVPGPTSAPAGASPAPRLAASRVRQFFVSHRIWLLQIPLIILFTTAFIIDEQGIEGRLNSPFLRESVLPLLRRVTALHTDLKFKMRGPIAPKNKIVVVEIDTPSLDEFGRWPWHRDQTARLIDAIFKYQPKVVGLDIFFPEPEKRVPEEMRAALKKHDLEGLADQFDGDPVLTRTIAANADRLVLGWASESPCQPLYDGNDGCPVQNPEALALLPQGFDKFGYQKFNAPASFDPGKTPFISLVTLLSNLPSFESAAKHAGYVLAFPPDPDSNVRRLGQFVMVNGKPYPSLGLEMARVGLGEELQLTLDAENRVSALGFARSGRNIPVTPLGVMQPNFRGPAHTFTYVEAADLLHEGDKLEDPLNRKLAGIPKLEALRDAYVIVGITAVGLFDIKAMPFDHMFPGVELHANVLDNLLSGDAITQGSMSSATTANGSFGSLIVAIAMVVGAGLFAYAAQKLQAIPALVLFVLVMSGLTLADLKLLFSNNQHWNTSFLLLEISAIFAFTLALKYVMEEQSKKFLRAAFTKYVSPAVVDSIILDPSKLSLGGEKREMTILFSDIRSFTTFSERMDAKQLAGFLNDYLGIMTNLVFDHRGTLDKYIGDAVMAFWGAPLNNARHAGDALRAAVSMMKSLREHQERFKKQYDIHVDIGIGINSGMVNVGNMGSANNFEYTVIGDSVNLASRLEGLTKPYGCAILTTRFTFDDIASSGDELPAHRVIDFVKVKGKKKAVEIIQVLHRDYDRDGLRMFEEARKAYEARKWEDAIEKFTVSNQLLCEGDHPDGPSEMYIERCQDFQKSPPGDAWDGSWEMTSK